MVSYKFESEVNIIANGVSLPGYMHVPMNSMGIIVFAHGSGSSRKSRRNQYVARCLNRAGFATLLFDLLAPTEESDRSNLFNISLLGERLISASEWVQNDRYVGNLPLGYFGASTGAAAALYAAAHQTNVFAAVSRGGRPDLASAWLKSVDCPVLLIVGGHDPEVLDLNREAALILADCQIEVIPNAGHIFEEHGALDKVVDLVRNWFEVKLYSYRSSEEELGNAFA